MHLKINKENIFIVTKKTQGTWFFVRYETFNTLTFLIIGRNPYSLCLIGSASLDWYLSSFVVRTPDLLYVT